VFHILGPSIASLDQIAEIAAYLGDTKYFMVKNFINNTHYFQWDEQTNSSYFNAVKDAVEVTIPKLNEMACEQVDLACVSFPLLHRQQEGERRPRRLFVRAARLCPALAGQRLDRVRPHQVDRPRGGAHPGRSPAPGAGPRVRRLPARRASTGTRVRGSSRWLPVHREDASASCRRATATGC